MRLSFNHVIKEPWSSTKGLFNARKIRKKNFFVQKYIGIKQRFVATINFFLWQR